MGKKALLSILLTVVLISMVLNSCDASTQTPGAPSQTSLAKTVKIGLVFNLGSDIGLDATRGIELLAQEDNKNGGLNIGGEKYKVELIKYDNEYKQSTEVAAINRLVFDDKVKFICTMGSFTGAWNKTTEENKVITLTLDMVDFIALAPWTHYSFNPVFEDLEIPAKTGWFCRKYPESKNIIIACIDNQFGHMAGEMSPSQYQAFGVTPQIIYFPANQVDLSAVSTKILSLKPSAITVLSGSSATDGLLFSAVHQAGYRGLRWLPTNNAMSTWLHVMSPEVLEGMITGMYANETEPALTKTAQHFKDLWIAQHGQWTDPLAFGVSTYSCLRTALVKAGTLDTDKVADVIASGLEFSTPTGDGKMVSRPDMGISRTVDSVCDYNIKQVRNGKAEIIAKITADEAIKLWSVAKPPLPPGATYQGPPMSGGAPAGAPPVGTPPGTPPAPGTAIPWDQALKLSNFGEIITVTGPVTNVISMGSDNIILLGGSSPMDSFPVASDKPLDSFKNKTIEATGVLERNPTGGPSLRITDPSRIKVK